MLIIPLSYLSLRGCILVRSYKGKEGLCLVPTCCLSLSGEAFIAHRDIDAHSEWTGAQVDKARHV
jgi:hypothetical protein